MEPPDQVAAVILAAGEARRFGSPKQLALLNGRTLLQHVIDAALQAGLAPIITIVPPGIALPGVDVTRIENPEPERGMSHSLRLGFANLPAEVNAALVLLGDQPMVGSRLIGRLLAARGATPFVATLSEGARVPPVLVERSHFGVVEQASGDVGLRDILRRHAELVTAVDEPRMAADVDTVDDLHAIGGG
jgi:molybdenum cofactor cytidylyltransferase